MASEKPIAAKRGPKAGVRTITRGNQRWRVDPEELRIREGTIDENGIRRIPYFKDDSAQTNAMTQAHYLKMGYEVADKGDYLEFSIPHATYVEKIEKPAQELAVSRVLPTKRIDAKDRQEGIFMDTLDIDPEPVSVEDLA